MRDNGNWVNLNPSDDNEEGLNPMTEIERTELEQYEQVIEAGLQTWYEVGTALLAIRDKRLYRAEFSNFEDYCKERWGFTKRRANQLIGASEVVNNLSKWEDELPTLPQVAVQAEEISRLKTPEQQREAWHKVIDTAPEKYGRVQITGPHVERVVDEMLGKSPAQPIEPEFNYKRDAKQARAVTPYQPQGNDACQTPPYAIDPLLPYLRMNTTVWEPAAGEQSLVEAFYDAGVKEVIVSDLITGQNFLEYEPSQDWDYIITNPPFTLKFEFLSRCYDLGKPFALLVPVEMLGAGKAQALMQVNGFEIMLLSRRVDFKMPNAGWSGAGSQFPTCWLCWNLLPQSVVFGDIPLAVKKEFHSNAR